MLLAVSDQIYPRIAFKLSKCINFYFVVVFMGFFFQIVNTNVNTNVNMETTA